jgi:hypothetical protein
MCWHGHINQGKRPHRLVRRRQHAGDLQPRRELLRAGKAQDEHFWEVSDAGSQEYRFPGMTPAQAWCLPSARRLARRTLLEERRLGDADARPVS